MNIEITATEYRDLLDILHIADVAMSGHRREEDSRTARHRALIQKLYALAGGEGLERLISYDDTVKRYIPTEDFEKSTLAHLVIEEFGDHYFWDLLISRLTERDAAQMAGGSERLQALNDIDRRHAEGLIRQRYLAEFAANGVANLEVVVRYGSVEGMPKNTSD